MGYQGMQPVPKRGEVLGKGARSEPPSHQLEGLWCGALSFPSGVRGRAPAAQVSNGFPIITAPSWGLLCPFQGRGAESPSNTMWPGPKATSVPIDILIHLAVWPQKTWAKNWGLCHFGRKPPPRVTYSVAWPEAYLRTKWHLDPSNRLATIH